MHKLIQLKKPITSKKFNVVFPALTDLYCFTDVDKNIFAEHPKHKNVYIKVAKSNIKN